MHNAHQMGIMNTYQDLGVGYTQWSAAQDDRTRDSHAEIDGEIIPLGEKFSNGLEYPGDTNGDISEWINCRCSNIPYIIPYGYIAPSFSPFREEDLIPIETLNIGELIEENNLLKDEISSFHALNNERRSPKNWKITNVNKLPSSFSYESKKLIKEFEGAIVKNLDGNEWAQVYNLTKMRSYPIYTEGKPNSVNPLDIRDYGNDKLIVIHNHTTNQPLNYKDIPKLLVSHENIVCLIAITPNKIFAVIPKVKGSIGDEKAIDLYKYMHGILNKYVFDYGVDSFEEANNLAWEKYKSDKNINKYIREWIEVKK